MTAEAPRWELTPKPLAASTDLAETPFAILLGRARALRASGVMRLNEQKRVFFWRGEPVGVRTDLAEENSEVYMVRHGIVAKADVEHVRRRAGERKSGFGEALLGLGVLEANQLYEHTCRLALQNLTTCFRWERGPVEWTPLERLGGEIVPVPIDLADVLAGGVSRFYDRRRLDRELPVADTARVYAKPPPNVPTAGASLGTLDARIFQLAAGRPTVQSIAVATGLPDKTVRERLYVLYCLGIVGFEQGVPPVAKPPSKVPTLQAFAAPSPSSPPPRRIATPAVQMPAAAVPTRRPTKTLVSAAAPRGSVADLREQAELARAARQYLVAIGTLRSALTLAPEDPVVLADLALTLMLRDPRQHAREANRLVREARRLDPLLSTSYVVMGMLMEQVGEKERAQRLYRYALDRDPQDGDAVSCLEKLGERI